MQTGGLSRAVRLSRRRHVAALFALYLILATGIAGAAVHLLHNRSTPVAEVNSLAFGDAGGTPKYLVLMVLDGARPDYFNVSQLPHVQALEQAGTVFTKGMDGILEAETPSGHATIATGSRPSGDGILGFDWGTDTGRYSLFDPAKMPEVEQLLQDSGAPTIGGLYKAHFPGATVAAVSGHKYYAAAPLGGPQADAIVYYEGDPKGRYVPVAVPGHVPPAGILDDASLIDPTTHLADSQEDHLATRMVLALANKMRPRIMLINFPEFDWPLGHVDGGSLDPAGVTTDMRGFDTDLGRIEDAYRAAGILDQTLFVITADHGMMPITRFIPSTVVTNAISQAGATSSDIASNTADYIWLTDPTRAQAVAQNVMKANDPGIQEAYYLTTANGKPAYVSADPSAIDSATEAVNQYLLSALLNGHEPQVVVFGDEGQSFSDPSSKWKGDHGGSSWQSQHMPLILAGPGIKSGQVIDSPVQLDDIAPTVLADMGVAPTGMQGTVLADALMSATPAERSARASELNTLVPVASALESLDGSNDTDRQLSTP